MPPELATAPDPSTNTAPTPTVEQGLAPGAEWDFLDDQPEVPDDPMRFRDELEEESEAEAAKAEAGEAATEPVQTEQSEEKKVEVTETPTLTPEIETKLTQWEGFDTALRENPVGVATAIVQELDPRQRAAFIASLGVTPEAARNAFDHETYEPQNELETALRERWLDIDAIPQIISDIQDTRGQIGQQAEMLIPHIVEANIESQVALAKIEALCEILDIKLPSVNPGDIKKNLNGGKVKYSEAVRKSIDRKAIEAVKQARSPRPRTPANENRTPESWDSLRDKNTGLVSMDSIARRLGTLP